MKPLLLQMVTLVAPVATFTLVTELTAFKSKEKLVERVPGLAEGDETLTVEIETTEAGGLTVTEDMETQREATGAVFPGRVAGERDEEYRPRSVIDADPVDGELVVC